MKKIFVFDDETDILSHIGMMFGDSILSQSYELLCADSHVSALRLLKMCPTEIAGLGLDGCMRPSHGVKRVDTIPLIHTARELG